MSPIATTAPAASESDLGLVDAFAGARADDAAAIPLVHARLAAALFGADAAGGLGRFHVRERLGAGAMGTWPR